MHQNGLMHNTKLFFIQESDYANEGTSREQQSRPAQNRRVRQWTQNDCGHCDLLLRPQNRQGQLMEGYQSVAHPSRRAPYPYRHAWRASGACQTSGLPREIRRHHGRHPFCAGGIFKAENSYRGP